MIKYVMAKNADHARRMAIQDLKSVGNTVSEAAAKFAAESIRLALSSNEVIHFKMYKVTFSPKTTIINYVWTEQPIPEHDTSIINVTFGFLWANIPPVHGTEVGNRAYSSYKMALEQSRKARRAASSKLYIYPIITVKDTNLEGNIQVAEVA